MQKRLMSIILAVMLLAAMATTAGAATYEEINQDAVFVKQSQRGTCTLASTAMMLRRAAMLNGDENWVSITEASCRSAFWLAGRGLPYHFTYGTMTVDHARLPGGQANRQVLIDLLAEHPEGIMLHAACVPHGILLTEYKDGQFYCADPSEFAGIGIIPIEQAWGTRIENSNAYWYVSSEVADPTQAPVVPEASAASIHPDTTTLLTGPKADEEETACLIGQALGVHA